jgi:hypothetical protein
VTYDRTATAPPEGDHVDDQRAIMDTRRELDGTEFLQTFAVLADTLVDDFDLVELLYLLIERSLTFTSADAAGILLVDEAGALQCMAASEERTRLLELFQIQNAEGPCRDAIERGRPLHVGDLRAQQERWPTFAPKALSVGFVAVHAVPLRLRGQTLGAMNLFSTTAGGVGPSERLVAQAMADVATIGILQQRGVYEAQTVIGQLQQALQSRVVIEQAKGVVAQQASVGMDDAFDLLRTFARHRNLKLGAVVAMVVEGRLAASQLEV